MNIREVASKFCVYVCTADLDVGASAKVAISKAGFEVYFLENDVLLLDRVQQHLPHIIVLQLQNLSMMLSQLIENLVKVSPELKFIFLNADEDFHVLTEYSSYGVMDILWTKSTRLDQRIAFSVERCCERIYLNYQNEQLYAQMKKTQASTPVVMSLPSDQLPESSSNSIQMHEIVKDYKMAQTKEEILQFFLNLFPSKPLFFFRYLSSVYSVVLTQSSQPLGANLQKLGCQLRPEESRDILQQIELGIIFPSLASMFGQVGLSEDLKIYPILSHHELDGFLIYETKHESPEIENQIAVMKLAYSNFCLARKVELLDVMDPVTELPNHTQYLRSLHEEFERAKRIQQPLSLIKLSLDDFNEIESSLGEVSRDNILKNLGAIMLKTNRANDLVFRTGINEFSILLPHCSRRGAEVRCERTRRIVESTSLIDHGMKMSISLGACEYPSIVNSAEKMDDAAARALQFIAGKGGNRLCFFKAASDHVPEFVVKEVPLEKEHL